VLIPAQKSGRLTAHRALTSSGLLAIEDLVERVPSTSWSRPAEIADAPQLGRRALNVVLALVGIVLATPAMLLIALLVKLTSPGPVIFRQTRVGLDRRSPDGSDHHWRRRVDYGGRLFTMYKFRTMTASGEGVQVWAQPRDPRVTPLGAVLRKYRLDELPQLFNVLKGDMNIVGPRPEQPKIFAELRDQIDRYPERQRVLPGITGWAQINQSYDRCLSDVRNKLSYDLEYIERESALQDLLILLRTVPVIVFKRGAW
jgi:lipopolysaccharide/colanic/teichoic acid biosynthesis glycosyltransferase